jgi:hypothetical protein
MLFPIRMGFLYKENDKFNDLNHRKNFYDLNNHNHHNNLNDLSNLNVLNYLSKLNDLDNQSLIENDDQHIVIVVQCQMGFFLHYIMARISYIQWNVDEPRFVLLQYTELDLYSASSLKQQGKHVARLGHTIKLVFVLLLRSAHSIKEKEQMLVVLEAGYINVSEWRDVSSRGLLFQGTNYMGGKSPTKRV